MTTNIRQKIYSFVQDPLNIFYFITVSGLIGFFICACMVKEGSLFDWFIIGNNSDWALTDFHRAIFYSADLKNTYFTGGGGDAPQPALLFIFTHFLYLINPQPYGGIKYILIPYEILIYVMWTVLQVCIMVYLVQKLTKLSLGNATFFTIMILFSTPYFSGVLERGNTIFITVIFLCGALYLRENKSIWQRQTALILIACAAGFKALPCIMGLLYIREKKYREALHLFIWGIILCLLPFIFTGGWAGFVEYIKIITNHVGSRPMRWASLPGFVNYWVYFFRGSLKHMGIPQLILQTIFCCSMIYFSLTTKERWKAVFYLSMIMAYSHSGSYRYYTAYLTLPLLLLVADRKNFNTADICEKVKLYIYYILFASVFVIPVWIINFGDVEHWMCGSAYVLCLYCVGTDIFASKKSIALE